MKKTKSTILVCRGNNPLFKALEDRLHLETEYINMDDERANDCSATQKYIKKLSKQYGLVLTDNSMNVGDLKNVVSVYSLLEGDWIRDIKQVGDYFRGRQNVAINPYGLTHHLYRECGADKTISKLEKIVGVKRAKELKKMGSDGPFGPTSEEVYLGYLLAELIEAKCIPNKNSEGFVMSGSSGDIRYNGTVTEALRKMGLNLDNTVVLVDHHVYRLRESDVKKTEFDRVKIYPICPCCIGLNEGYKSDLKKRGFSLTKNMINNEIYFKQLVGKIECLIKA